PEGQAAHLELLRAVAQKERPVWVGPQTGQGAAGQVSPANLTSFGVFLAPILVDREAIGVLEVWQEPPFAAEGRKGGARVLAESPGVSAALLQHARWQQVKSQQQLWGQLEAFCREIHASLDPAEVACLVANRGRQL